MLKIFKKIWLYLAIIVIAVVAAINMNANANRYGLSDMELANVEALAQCECEIGAFYCTGYPIVLVCVWTSDGYPYDVGERVWL